MRLRYMIYGLLVLAEYEVPGAVAAPFTGDPDVVIEFGTPKDINVASRCRIVYPGPSQGGVGSPNMECIAVDRGRAFCLRYRNGLDFWIDRCGTRIWIHGPGDVELDDVAITLLGPVFGFLLRLRGIVCLHASAIKIGDEVIAVLGPSGAGKSTTAAALALRGHTVLADDVVALADLGSTFHVQPAYPRLRLWPKSVAALYGDAEALPRLTSDWEKRYLDLTELQPHAITATDQLAAIYLLGARADNTATEAIEVLSPNGVLMSLVSNTYTNYLLDPGMRATEFEVLGRLARSVHFRQLILREDITRLPELCDLILRDYGSRSTGYASIS